MTRRELVSVSSVFRVPYVTALRLGLAICVRCAEPPLRHELKNHRRDPGISVLQGKARCFVIEVVLRKIEDIWCATRLQIRLPIFSIFFESRIVVPTAEIGNGLCHPDKLRHFLDSVGEFWYYESLTL